MTQRIITFANGESFTAEVERLPDEPHKPIRYEVEVEEGISTGEMDAHGDNPTFAWTFPCKDIDEAVKTVTKKGLRKL